jgi:hypothetical protein
LDAEILLAMAAAVFLHVIMLLVFDACKLTVSMKCDNFNSKLTFSYLSVNFVQHTPCDKYHSNADARFD